MHVKRRALTSSDVSLTDEIVLEEMTLKARKIKFPASKKSRQKEEKAGADSYTSLPLGTF